MRLCSTVSHTVNLFVHTSLLASVHCKESLVCLDVFRFYYTINAGSSLGLFLGILLLLCVMDILQHFLYCSSS